MTNPFIRHKKTAHRAVFLFGFVHDQLYLIGTAAVCIIVIFDLDMQGSESVFPEGIIKGQGPFRTCNFGANKLIVDIKQDDRNAVRGF